MADTTEEHIKVLLRHRFTIVQQLQVERSFLFDYLLSKNVFDRDDYDMVRSEKTREKKAAKVLDIIETKGEHGFNHFKDALQLINPNLYETLTGEKATINSGDGLPRLIDQDILSSHLKRVTDDLRDMTLRYNTILKENQQYRKVTQQSTRDNNELANRVKILEMMLAEAEAVASKTYSDASYTLRNQYDTIQKDRHVNKDFIIQLQMKLLQSQEKYEEKTRQLDEYTRKYKKLETELLKVNENYSFQRSETKKLSATLKTRTEEAKYCDELKKQCREKQFKIMELQSDKEDREKEIEELKNWTTALKRRFDTVLQERNEIMAKQHETVENLSLSKNNITDMDIKVKRLNRELMEVKKERDKLESETTMLKSRVTSEHNSYVKMTDKIEELKAYFSELIETKEKELAEKKEYVEYLQEEVEDLKKELAESKKEMKATLITNDNLTCDLRKLRSQYNATVESLEQQLSAWEKSCEDTENTDEEEEEDDDDEEDEKDKTQDHTDDGACYKSGIRRMSTRDLLKSIRRRFERGLSQPCLHQQEKVPYVSSLSADFSSQRESTQFKIRTLPFDALACMYSGSTEDNGALLRSTLPGFYNRERMQHARKTSSPLPLSACAARYLNSISHESLAEQQELENQGNSGTKKTTVATKESDRSDVAFRPRSCVVRRHSDISHSKNSTTLKSFIKPI